MSITITGIKALDIRFPTSRALRRAPATLPRRPRAPPARYPPVEDVLWHAVQRAIVGELDIDRVLAHMTCQIGRIVRGD